MLPSVLESAVVRNRTLDTEKTPALQRQGTRRLERHDSALDLLGSF